MAFQWLSRLFSTKKEPDYNVFLVRAKERPDYFYEKKKTIIKISSQTKFSLSNLNIFPEGAEFFAINPSLEQHLKDIIVGSDSLWAIKTLQSHHDAVCGTEIVYFKNNKLAYREDAELVRAILAQEGMAVVEPMVSTSTPRTSSQEQSPKENDDDNTNEAEARAQESAPTVITNAAEAVKDNIDKPEKLEETSAKPKIPSQSADDSLATAKAVENPADTQKEMAEASPVKTTTEDKYSELLNQLVQVMYSDSKTDKNPQEILQDLKDRLSNLEKRGQQLDQARTNCQKLEDEKNELSIKLQSAKNEAKKNAEGLTARFEQEKRQISKEKDDLQTMLDELLASDAGHLAQELEETKKNLAKANAQCNDVGQEITIKENIIKEKNAQIDELARKERELAGRLDSSNKQLTELSNSVSDKQRVIDENAKTISELKTQVKLVTDELAAKETETQGLSNDLRSANHTITSLKSEVGARDIKIKNLEVAKEKLETEIEKHVSSRSEDISSLTDCYVQAVESLTEALRTDFLTECNPDAETDTVESMCAKIRKGIQLVSNAITDLKNKDFATVNELRNEYEQIIGNDMDSYAFKEIARWWAYSRLPFIANQDREEGRAVDMAKIQRAYQALCHLLSLAGYSYQQPALFVENFNEGVYDDRTGREQLNLEYQYPNVRAHVAKIDRQDRDSTVLDIVKLGYYHNGKLVKPSEVIL